jgi:hypothetical protein
MSDARTKGSTVNEEEAKTQRGSGGMERQARSDGKKEELQRKVKAIREGHLTGGYCDTEALHAEERKLDKIIRAQLEEAKAKHGYSPDPKFKHPEIRALELELHGLSWKPELVVKGDQ